jgi:hypothetical protein
MEYTIQVIMERTVRFRKQLAELEKKRAQFGSDVPNELWKELIQVSRSLDREERKAQAACRIKSKQVNDTREDIIETLEKYSHWRKQMRQVEDLFLVHVVRPGYRLRQAVLQREYLEGEYQNIRRNIDNEHYLNLEELKSDIQRVLTRSDTAFEDRDDEFIEEETNEVNPLEVMEDFDLDQLVDEIEQEAIVREFKRVVLPAIHPDTSNTPGETFKTVYEAFEKHDYLLMQAYVVEYRGEIVPDPNEDPLFILEQLDQYQDDYSKLEKGLDRRMNKMWKDLTPQEREEPDQLQEKLRMQQTELSDRIQMEAERILQLRQQIEDLDNYYLNRKDK